MLPSQFPEFVAYPTVYGFVKHQLDMQFNDVRAMMKLPLPEVGIDAGCNFATVATLCNLIGGISAVLYAPRHKISGSRKRNDRGKRFKTLLEEFYPWDRDEDRMDKAKTLYEIARNPLVHALGVLDKARGRRVIIKKSPLIEDQIEEMERSDIRPDWVSAAVTIDPANHIINVWGLYWGVFHLVRQLAKNADQMQAAEKRISSGKIVDRD